MREYIKTPSTTSFKEILDKDYSLSASQHKHLLINNLNQLELRDFLDRELKRKDLGIEIGSDNYISDTNYFFIKPKALQPENFTIDETKESCQEMNPNSFVKMNLKKGDIIISKDSNVGEVIILDKDYPNYMLSGALYKLPITKLKYYVLAFIKSDLFRQQIDVIVPRGSTIRHGKTMFLDCKIPIPNKNEEKAIKYIEMLTEAIINKEIEIKAKHKLILETIETELRDNQGSDKFEYKQPSLNELLDLDRMDSCLYSEDFKKKEFLIRNYINGVKTIHDLGFKISRGQNLQVSNIGKSIYTSKYHSDFYRLMMPKHLTKYGTVISDEYLGNSNKLKLVKKGDVIFGAEGNEKGRSIAIIEDLEPTITNIHGITLNQKKHDKTLGIFVKLILDYYRDKGLIDAYAVGGNGGSLAIKYWDYIKFPNFASEQIATIAKLYHNEDSLYDISSLNFEKFPSYDAEFNKKAGIYELDKSMKKLKKMLDIALNQVIDDENVVFPFIAKESN